MSMGLGGLVLRVKRSTCDRVLPFVWGFSGWTVSGSIVRFEAAVSLLVVAAVAAAAAAAPPVQCTMLKASVD